MPSTPFCSNLEIEWTPGQYSTAISIGTPCHLGSTLVSCFVTQTQANRIFLWGESEINTYQKHRYDPWNNKERIRKKQLTIMSEDCSGFHFFRPNKAEPLTLRQCLNCWLRSRPALSLSLKLRLCLLHCKRLGRCQRGGWLATSWELAVLGLRPDRGLLRFQPPLC